MPPARPPPFVHLHVHSAYSFQGGTSLPEVLVARAATEGHGALALTDLDGAYELPAFQDLADAAGLRALHGAEITDPRRDERAVVLVKDDAGYRSLCRLLTRRHLEARFTLEDDLADEGEGLVVLTPSPRLLEALHDAFAPDDLHGEIVAHAPEATRRAIWEAARAHRRGVVGTFRVFFARAREHAPPRLRLATAHLRRPRDVAPGAPGRDARPLDLAPSSAWLQPPAAAARAFATTTPEAAAATVQVAERLRWRFVRPARPRLPALVAEASGPKADDAYGRLAALCLEGIPRRYGHLCPEVFARLERELRVIRDRGFCDYFLIVHDLVRFAREEAIPCVGRGSAANSLVAYALGITAVEPLRYDLPFERFLSPARRDCPDIDLDIDWRGRDRVIAHVYDTYGSDRVAMISTHVGFQARGAFREAAKTLGLPPPEIDRVARHLPSSLDGAWARGRRPPELASVPLDRTPWTTALRAARALEGLPRHLSIHVGGIVVGDGGEGGGEPPPLADSLPLERSAKGRVVTQYDMHGVEATGLVKIDLLGNRALAVIRDVVLEAGATYGETIDLDAVPEEDPRAGDLLASGATLGCFQVESPGMRNLVVRMGARTQQDDMIALSLIRPGPAGSGMKDAYVRRRRGEEAVPTLHPVVDPLFAATQGVMLYQEDTLRAAVAVAGFTLTQADLLRRAFSKKRRPEDLPEMERLFRGQAAERGIPPKVVEAVWASIRRFSAYAYNKAHAATYGRISWLGLYLKARYPAEYLASVLRNRAGFYAPRAYVEEARRLGVRIELPCVNRSAVGPTGRRGALRLGLDQIKGLRHGTPGALVRIREATGLYVSPTDLLLRSDLQKHEAERLVLSGALDVFDRPRGELLWTFALDFDCYLEAREETHVRSALFGPTAL
ncbi:MAG: DNA polymerase III subunit alpha, partial [Planctomycetota bacterium]